ncbi:MAG TPA: 2Fe-2S iron-sulfur cluster binding domain-containing protein [Xanthobacteraceae bacterium]|jgi:toluene monooxygenase electron transfer component
MMHHPSLPASRSLEKPSAEIEARTKVASCAFAARPDEPLLYAALRAGVAAPYECATGTCGTCKARRLSGVIVRDWAQAPGNVYLRADRDEVLLCQTRALGDASFDIPGSLNLAWAARSRPCFGTGSVARIGRLTEDVVELMLELDGVLDFDAGQFAVLQVPHVPGYRAYSMVNHPGASRLAQFVIKQKPSGAFTSWLFSLAKAGDPIEWFGPLGKAIFTPTEQRSILCIAGGSGIASIMSILEVGCSSRHFEQFQADVFFGIRTRTDVFYLDALERFASEFPGMVRIKVAMSHDEPTSELRGRHPSLGFESGFPHEIAARDLAGSFAGRVAYIAGPPVLVDVSIRMLVSHAKLPVRDIRYDKFS